MIDPRDPDFTNTPVSPQRPHFHYVADRRDDERGAPIVTVVTGTSCAHENFRETARCVIGQSLQSWEWLIVDDESPERHSREILGDIAASDRRICVIEHAENRGPGAARNTAVTAARGHYIYFIDDDDLLEPTTFEQCLWFLETHPEYDFVNGWSVAFGGQCYLWEKGFDQNDAFLDDNLATGRCMMRKHAYEAAGGTDESLTQGFEDWDLWLRCARRGSWGSTIPHFMDWYRRRKNHSDRWGAWDSGKREKQFRRRLRQRYSDLYANGFPRVEHNVPAPFTPIDDSLPCENRLAVTRRRVLLILPWLSMGGSDKFNLDLVEGLRKRGFEVTIVTTLEGHSGWESEFARHTPDIFHLHHFLPLAQYARFVRYLIASRQPETVLASHSEFAYLIAPYLRAHCPDPVYLDYCHIEQEEWMAGGYPRLALSTQAHFDVNLVSSEHLRNWMGERGADTDAIRVLYTNVDTSRWKPQPRARQRLRREWQIEEDTPLILFSGRICAQKQPMVLAHSLHELVKRGQRFKLVIAGNGEQRGKLEAFIRREGLTRWVRFLGEIPNDDVRDVMSAADILFLPSQWEGIALVLFEAMAMELAVVTADVGGQRELVAPAQGILLPRADETAEAKAYAEALQALLEDPERRRCLGRRGRERVRSHFSLDRMLDSFVAIIAEAKELRAQSGKVPLPRELAASWAVQAVEYIRMSKLADHLWAEKERAGGRSTDVLSGHSLAYQLHTSARLDYIESSRSWRCVRRLHAGAPGRLARRLGMARDLDAISAIDNPERRLAEIEATLSYRILRTIKATPVHQLWVRVRYGEDRVPREQLD